MNECASDNDCHANAQCTNTDGSYTCSCLDGYAGDGKNCTGWWLCAAVVYRRRNKLSYGFSCVCTDDNQRKYNTRDEIRSKFVQLILVFQIWMNVQVTMSATRTPSVRTQTVATRAAVVTVTREMGRTAQVSG